MMRDGVAILRAIPRSRVGNDLISGYPIARCVVVRSKATAPYWLLYFYGARWYDPVLGRFTQADSIIPSPGNPMAWDRYAYVMNSPMKYTDPTGHANDEGGGGGIYDDVVKELIRQDYLISWILMGSGENGAWTAEDWDYYHENKQAIWNDPSCWKNPDPNGWEGFTAHVERLLSHYEAEDEDQFVRDFALMFGGISSEKHWASAALSVAHGPNLPFINEGNDGLSSQYIDTLSPEANQSHHYVGLFFLGYYTDTDVSIAINYFRDPDNPGDIFLGEQAARDGSYFHRYGSYLVLQSMLQNLSK